MQAKNEFSIFWFTVYNAISFCAAVYPCLAKRIAAPALQCARQKARLVCYMQLQACVFYDCACSISVLVRDVVSVLNVSVSGIGFRDFRSREHQCNASGFQIHDEENSGVKTNYATRKKQVVK